MKELTVGEQAWCDWMLAGGQRGVVHVGGWPTDQEAASSLRSFLGGMEAERARVRKLAEDLEPAERSPGTHSAGQWNKSNRIGWREAFRVLLARLEPKP